MKGSVSSPYKFSDPLLSCLRVRLSDSVSGASATTWQTHISPMIFMPVVVPRKEIISWSKADRGKQCFSCLCLALLSAVCNRRRKEYSKSVRGRAPVELDASQCCLQQLPPNYQLSNPHLWKGLIVTAFVVKASSESRRLCALEINVGPFNMGKALCGSVVFPR
jgi:hypothetical protein